VGVLFSNRYLDASAKTMLFFGVIHLTILAYQAFRGNVEALNVFSIMSLNLIVPGLDKGPINFALSYGMLLGVYVALRLYLNRSSKKTVIAAA
jgi:hypothetical protein